MNTEKIITRLCEQTLPPLKNIKINYWQPLESVNSCAQKPFTKASIPIDCYISPKFLPEGSVNRDFYKQNLLVEILKKIKKIKEPLTAKNIETCIAEALPQKIAFSVEKNSSVETGSFAPLISKNNDEKMVGIKGYKISLNDGDDYYAPVATAHEIQHFLDSITSRKSLTNRLSTLLSENLHADIKNFYLDNIYTESLLSGKLLKKSIIKKFNDEIPVFDSLKQKNETEIIYLKYMRDRLLTEIQAYNTAPLAAKYLGKNPVQKAFIYLDNFVARKLGKFDEKLKIIEEMLFKAIQKERLNNRL